MDLATIKTIFASNKLSLPRSFRKIDVGFTNIVYAIDEEYILKVCNDINNELPFSLEAKLYERFKTDLPVPQLIAFDATKKVLPNTTALSTHVSTYSQLYC